MKQQHGRKYKYSSNQLSKENIWVVFPVFMFLDITVLLLLLFCLFLVFIEIFFFALFPCILPGISMYVYWSVIEIQEQNAAHQEDTRKQNTGYIKLIWIKQIDKHFHIRQLYAKKTLTVELYAYWAMYINVYFCVYNNSGGKIVADFVLLYLLWRWNEKKAFYNILLNYITEASFFLRWRYLGHSCVMLQ